MKPSIHMIGTTHFDPVWMWTWDEGMASIRSTFRSALDRMNEDDNFIYSFSCPPVFEWIREVDPALFEEIRRRVDEGRWELVEGWWVQPHCFSSLGESYIRQGLYGQRYLMERFGKRSRTAFNTDSFGHCDMLPQLLRHCGVEAYVFGRPSNKRQQLPDNLFRWRSPDGSSVLVFRCGGENANAYSRDLEADLAIYAKSIGNADHDMLMIYGVSNHGGAPTKAAIAAINKFRESGELESQVDFDRVDTFFDSQADKDIVEYDQELITCSFGVYVNGAETKIGNRRSEISLLNAEKAALIANRLIGRVYPKSKLTELWEDALFNQFHDIIGGASVPDALVEARDLHGKILWESKKIIHYSLQSISKDVDASGEGFPLIVWNLNAFGVKTAVEAELQWAWEFDWYDGPLTVVDANGRYVTSQIIQETSTLPRFRSRLVFEDDLPSLGYKLYYVRQEEPPVAKSDLKVDGTTIENERLKVEISGEHGGLASIIDKSSGKVTFLDAAMPLVMDDPGCTWTFNMGAGYEKEVGRFKFEKLQVLENGPVRTKVRVTSTFNQSSCEQDFILYAGAAELEGTTRVFWRETKRALKLAFDSSRENQIVTAATPCGWTRRERDNEEVPMGDWIDVGDPSSGASVITRGVSGYAAAGGHLGLTLLRSPVFAHHTTSRPVDWSKPRRYLDQGEHEFSWIVIPRDGKLSPSALERVATQLNNPPAVIDEANHPGSMPGERSFLDVKSEHVLLTTLKLSEDGDDVIARLVEYDGETESIDIKSDVLGLNAEPKVEPRKIVSLRFNETGAAKACDGLEK